MSKFLKSAALCFAAAMAHPVLAADCEFTVGTGDMLKFDVAEMTASASCDTVKVTLNHMGNLNAQVMGHNWVLAKTADVQAVAADGMSAGAASAYVKSGDGRVIAATAIIGGGESASVEFSIADLSVGGDYTFFCTFPGHSFVMRGKFKLEA
ncbi:MAG: azurin [Pseudomonadota bacterium]|nr:azurin [Pseudomonadota bacterium]